MLWRFSKYEMELLRLLLHPTSLNEMRFWTLAYLDYRTGLWSCQNHGSIKPGLEIHQSSSSRPQSKQRLSLSCRQRGGQGVTQRWRLARKHPIIRQKEMKGISTIEPFVNLSSPPLPQ